jgi:hypothetical protein
MPIACSLYLPIKIILLSIHVTFKCLDFRRKRKADSVNPYVPRSDEEEQLSGQTTPNPSGLDKRLPGISHQFHQVSPPFDSLSSWVESRWKDRKSADVVSELWGSKDTPPATPRGTTSTGSALNPTAASANAPSPTNPPVGPPKGKLIVKIIEAKDLIPSKYPYVVCTFESNEFISQGPRRSLDGVDGHGSEKNNRNGHANHSPPGGLGRSIAIPMTSRQSSSTSLSEMQGSKPSNNGTTNPRWEHNAVL